MEELDATVDIVMEGGRQGRRNRVRHESRLTGWRKGRLGGEDGNWVEAEGRKTGRTEKGKLRKEVDG